MLKQAQEMQKQANELQKQNATSPDKKKKLAEMLSQAKEEEARQEEQEKREKEKLQAALKKQLEAPGPVVLPNWTPATPQFKAAGAPTRKIVDDEVRIVQTGTSSLTPEKLADSWEAAAVAANNINHSRSNNNVNGKITMIMFLSTRTDPVQEVKLEASREPDSKITQVEISSPLPKPDIESE
jgi:type I site-specific restriction-modification system R (restriction) subunit